MRTIGTQTLRGNICFMVQCLQHAVLGCIGHSSSIFMKHALLSSMQRSSRYSGCKYTNGWPC